MKIKSLNITLSCQQFEAWDHTSKPNVSEDYVQVRTELENLFSEIKQYNDYQLDYRFGTALKDYFDKKDWFNLRVASDLGFWRYLSVVVIPYIVAQRWEDCSEDHFWKKPSRIWLRSIWWFAYLGWANDSLSDTQKLLSQPVFNTDVILNTVERTGRKGTHINTYKCILQTYGSLSPSVVSTYNKNTPKPSDTLFRSIMRLNTAKILVMEPQLCEGGVQGYVNSLFSEINIQVTNAYFAPTSSSVTATIPTTPVAQPKNVQAPTISGQISTSSNDEIKVIVADITTLSVDAIVNAANASLSPGGGICGAIHDAAGAQLAIECRNIGNCPTGQSRITSAYNLPCKKVIHTVGPDCRVPYQNTNRKELLRSCYNTCLDLVEQNNLKSIAFCCISTGIFNYPHKEAAQIAIDTIRERLQQGLDCEVTICCYYTNDRDIYEELL